jgi:hypothetical protein
VAAALVRFDFLAGGACSDATDSTTGVGATGADDCLSVDLDVLTIVSIYYNRVLFYIVLTHYIIYFWFLFIL